MKIVVAVIIYDRFKNLETWLECWKKSETKNAELRIIHNVDNRIDATKYFEACEKANIAYVPRANIGHDIGALQDVCRGRLPGFENDFDFMLWCTDDTIPMRPTFLTEYINESKNLVACLEVSDETTRHIRTTGIYASKEVWQGLKFPADPHTVLDENYAFEHRGGEITMLRQFENTDTLFAMPWELKSAPLWDIDKRASLGRWDEWHRNFTSGPQILFIAPVHNTFPEIVSSLLCQTYTNWRLRLIHDGLNHTRLKEILDVIGDDRIEFLEMPDRVQRWGHPWRQWALERLKAGDYPEAEFVVVTNADNYYAPPFCEYMLKGFATAQTPAAFCDLMTHSYWSSQAIENSNKWATARVETRRGRIDCGGVMVRRLIAQEAGWQDIESHSSDWIYFEDIAKISGGFEKWQRVQGNLFVHN